MQSRRNPRANRWVAFAASATIALASPAAHAQTADDQQRAERLLEEGVSLRQRGDDDGALTRFRQAYELTRAPRALAQVALAEQAIGDWINADRDLRAALATTGDVWLERNRAALQGALQQIAHRIGTVDVRVNVPNAELWVDGTRIGTLPLSEPARLAAGAVMLEVRAEGYATLRRSVEVRGESLARETFNLVRIAAHEGPATNNTTTASTTNNASNTNNTAANSAANNTSSTSETRRSASGNSVPIGAVVLVGAGALTMATSGIFASMRGGAIGNCRIDGNTLSCPTQIDADRAASGRTYTTLVNVTLIGGAVLAAGGAAWWIASALTSPRGESSTRAMIVPSMVGPTGVGASVLGRF